MVCLRVGPGGRPALAHLSRRALVLATVAGPCRDDCRARERRHVPPEDAFLLKKLLFIARKYTGKMEASDPYAIVRDPLGVAPRTMQVSIVNARETSPLDQLLQAR